MKKIKKIKETTAGAVAAVVAPLGGKEDKSTMLKRQPVPEYDTANTTKDKPMTKKATRSKKINEGVLDDLDDAGVMAKRKLYDLAKTAIELHKLIQDSDDLEPWVQEKITLASEYIDTVKHSLDYDSFRVDHENPEIDDFVNGEDMHGLDELSSSELTTSEIDAVSSDNYENDYPMPMRESIDKDVRAIWKNMTSGLE